MMKGGHVQLRVLLKHHHGPLPNKLGSPSRSIRVRYEIPELTAPSAEERWL